MGKYSASISFRKVSILVFVELAPGQIGVIAVELGNWMFQSLFLWNSRPDVIPLDVIIFSSLVFQSLFLWNSRPDTPAVRLVGNHPAMFQSLFLWNSRPDRSPPRFNMASRKFQSLFLWNSRPDWRRRCGRLPPPPVSIRVFVELAPGPEGDITTPQSAYSFNPCFCGTRARTRSSTTITAETSVSILVFVELAPGRT